MLSGNVDVIVGDMSQQSEILRIIDEILLLGKIDILINCAGLLPLKFIQEVKQEAFKVTWPTGKETLQGTLMVVAMAIIASLFFLLLDQVLKFLLELLLKVSV